MTSNSCSTLAILQGSKHSLIKLTKEYRMKHIANVITFYYGERIIGRVDEIEILSTFRNHKRKVFVDYDWWYNFTSLEIIQK